MKHLTVSEVLKFTFPVDSPARSEAATDSDLGDLIPGLNYRCLVPKCQKIIQVSRQGGHRITDSDLGDL